MFAEISVNLFYEIKILRKKLCETTPYQKSFYYEELRVTRKKFMGLVSYLTSG